MIANQNNINLTSLELRKSGKSIDISEIFSDLIFFEDIFAPTMSGTIRLTETVNLPESFPIIGEETLFVSFTTYEDGKAQEKKFEKEFQIYKLSNWQNKTTTHLVSYTLHFVSIELIKNVSSRLNRSFGTEVSPMKSEDIVKNICTNILKIPSNSLNIESGKFDWAPLICSNWKPLDAISYIAKNDVSLGKSPTTFIFFEDKFGYNFVSWETLLNDRHVKQKEISTLFYKKRNPTKGITKEYFEPGQVISFILDESFDELLNSMNGMYSTKYIYHDIINKKITTSLFNYDSEFDRLDMVEDKNNRMPLSATRKINDAENVMILPNEYHFDNYTKIGIPWKQDEASRLQQFENYVLFAEVVGNSGYSLGSILRFDIPSPLKNRDGTTANYAHLSGKFLLTKIKHSIGPTSGYRQTLELRKGVHRKV